MEKPLNFEMRCINNIYKVQDENDVIEELTNKFINFGTITVFKLQKHNDEGQFEIISKPMNISKFERYKSLASMLDDDTTHFLVLPPEPNDDLIGYCKELYYDYDGRISAIS